IYDPATVFSSIDTQGRYAYENQPKLAAWNLARFAETLIPLLHTNQDEAVELAQNAVSDFDEIYKANWLSGMRAKLGIFNEELEDEALIRDLLIIMYQHSEDYTNTFRELTIDNIEDTKMFKTEEYKKWYKIWQARLPRQRE
ncbi:hypothetical protein GNF81_19685, partial [Clostridium perfringens]|nr:hypothetical protein [Clostridium perfringens]